MTDRILQGEAMKIKTNSIVCGIDDSVRCPNCGYVGSVEGFDCIGADGDNLFCPECSTEFDPAPYYDKMIDLALAKDRIAKVAPLFAGDNK